MLEVVPVDLLDRNDDPVLLDTYQILVMLYNICILNRTRHSRLVKINNIGKYL